MDITCISDLHGFYPELEGGDLLIVAGDLTAHDEPEEYNYFEKEWLRFQPYRKKILIAGNHDNYIQNNEWVSPYYYEYLCDSGTEFEGLKIWGSPWTKTFEGMNPHCKAFTVDTEEELAVKFSLIPDDVDILVTHGPPYGLLDWNVDGKQCGSESLFKKSITLKNLKLFIFGHIHEAYSMINCKDMENSLPMLLSDKKPSSLPIIVNGSLVNEHYQPVNKPIRVIL